MILLLLSLALAFGLSSERAEMFRFLNPEPFGLGCC